MASEHSSESSLIARPEPKLKSSFLGLGTRLLKKQLTVARKCLATNSYNLHSASLNWSLVALRIGVIGG